MILVLQVKCSVTVLLIYNYPIPDFPHFLSPSASGKIRTHDISVASQMFCHCASDTTILHHIFCHFISPSASGMIQTHDFRALIQVFNPCDTGIQPTYNP
jgi:hypothetical protein